MRGGKGAAYRFAYLQVLTLESFMHLAFLIQFGDKGSEGIPLSQAAPFFANSDPDMPAVPVPASQVHEWILENIAVSLEHTAEKVLAKESGPPGASDLDVTMTDACASQTRVQSSTSHSTSSYSRSQTFVEGVSKASVIKQASDIKGHSVKVTQNVFLTHCTKLPIIWPHMQPCIICVSSL